MTGQRGSSGTFFPGADGDAALRGYRELVDAVDAGLCRIDAEGRLLAVNAAVAALTGRDRRTLVGEHLSAVLDDAAAARVVTTVRALLDGDGAEEVDLSVPVETADGGTVTRDLRLRVLRGTDAGILGVFRPARGGTPEGARAPPDERLFARRVDNVPGIVYRCRDEPGRPMEFVSEGAADLTGYDPAALEAGAVSYGEDVVHPDDREDVRAAIREGVDGGGEFAVQYRTETADGLTRWVLERGQVVENPPDGPAVLEGVVTDITDQKETERALREEQSLTRGLFDAQPDIVYAADADGGLRRWNDRVPEVTGYDDEEMAAMELYDFVPDDAVDRARTAVEAAMEGGEGSTVELPLETADGERIPYEFSGAPFTDADGAVVGLTGVGRDVSDRKERERRLRRERDLNERLLEAAPAGILLVAPDGSVDRANERAQRLLGFDLEADGSFAMSDVDVYDEDGEFVPQEERPLHRVFETGEPVTDWECQLDLDDGRRWLSLNAAPVSGDDGDVEYVVVTSQDVTTLKEQAWRLQRRREELERELEDVFDRVDDAFYAVDDEWRLTYVNEQAEALLDRSERELLGQNLWEAFPDAVGTRLEEEYHRAMETQQRTTFEYHYPPLETWFEVRAYPSADGLSVYFEDVTARKQRERELEHYETLARTASEVVVRIDGDSTIRDINPAAEAVFGYDPDELVGESLTTLMPDRLADAHRAAVDRYLAEGVRHLDWDYIELPGVCADGTEIPLAISFSEYEHDGEDYFTGIVRDITERKERERELEEARRRYETLVENFPNGVVALVDEDLRYVTFGGTLEGDSDLSGADLEDEHLPDVLPADIADVVVPQYEAALDGEPSEVEAEIDGRVYQFRFVPVRDEDGAVFAAIGMSQDVTEHKERERTLERQRTELVSRERALRDAYQTITDPDRSFSDQVAELMALVRETVGIEYATLSRVDEERGDYVFEWVDVPADADLQAGDTVPLEATNCERVVAAEETLVLDDVAADAPELADRAGNADWGIESYLGTPVFVDGEVRGTFCVYDMDPRDEPFSEWEVAFVELLGNWISQELDRERYTERLATLNHLNDVVREVTDAVIDQSTREEIERTTCEALAAADAFEFAWMGEVDAPTGAVQPRVEAGVDGYVESVDISADADDPTAQGPTGRAVRTGEMQVVRDVAEAEEYEPWREAADEHGFRSSAAIPVTHEGTLYGVLNVYADRPDAFTGAEHDVVGQLGEVVGHAIAAVERKRALMSDAVTELEFHVEDVFAELDVPADGDGRIAIEQTVPLGDGEYLVYGTADEDGLAALDAIVDAVPHWTEVRAIDEELDGARFEVKLDEPPVLSTLASRGGDVTEAYIEAGDYRMTVQLPPGVEVREVVEDVKETYPAAELRAQRQVSRPEDGASRVSATFESELTDRQRSVLESAYHAGYFEWPRESSGEELAEALDIAPATFSQHLRRAESHIFGALFEGRTADGEGGAA